MKINHWSKKEKAKCPEEVMVKLPNRTQTHKESKMKSNTMHITTFTFFIFNHL